MRLILAFPLLAAVAACSGDNDSGANRSTVENAAGAPDVGVDNVAADPAPAIGNEAGANEVEVGVAENGSTSKTLPVSREFKGKTKNGG